MTLANFIFNKIESLRTLDPIFSYVIYGINLILIN